MSDYILPIAVSFAIGFTLTALILILAKLNDIMELLRAGGC